MTRATLRLVRWAVFIAAGAYLYLRLADGQGTYTFRGDVQGALAAAPAWFWPLMLALTVLNWGLEAAKWRRLMGRLQWMGLGRSFAATLAGTSIGLVTPNRTGEVVGRVLFLAPEHRWQGSFATLLGSIAQFATTVVIGVVAMGLWWGRSSVSTGMAPWGGAVLALLGTAVAVVTLVLYFQPHLLLRLILMFPFLGRLRRAARVLQGYARAELAAVLGLSMARYAIFCFQYLLFLSVFAGMGWVVGLWAVPVIYLVVTLVPTMMLTELGVRGSVAVAVLAPWGGEPAMVLLSSFGVWAVNLALPALAGAVVILLARINSRP